MRIDTTALPQPAESYARYPIKLRRMLSNAQELITAAPLLALYRADDFPDGRVGRNGGVSTPLPQERADLKAADLRDKEKPPRGARRGGGMPGPCGPGGFG
jgi:hypothetical protein